MSEEMVFQHDDFGPAIPAGPGITWTAPSWRVITQDVADRHGLTWDEITGVGQQHRIAHPRQEAFALIYATGKLSLPAIGRRFSRDHSTVLHGIRSYRKRLAEAQAT